MNVTRTLSVVPFVLAATLAACSSPAPSAEDIGSARERVIKGKNSDATQDAVVLVIFYDPNSGAGGSCTGTLLAPNLVLTARHCVADTDESAACDADGTPIAGGEVRGNRAASSLYIFTGAKHPDFGSRDLKPNATGTKILDDGGKNLCNHDISLILLKDPIKNAQIAPLRLDSPVLKTDVLTAVGWGVTDKTPMPNVRQQRAGIAIQDIGPDDSSNPPVAPNEFQVGESICSGDSGGPALADTGAIVGIVSRGGNQTQPNPNDPASSCTGSNAGNLYTKVSPFKDFILKGFELANAEPWLEGQPNPLLLKPDEACTDASECRSNMCLPDPSASDGSSTCAQECSDTDCPDGQTCTTVDDAKVCRAKGGDNGASPKSGGCATGAGASPNGFLALALCALGVVMARRRGR